MTNLVETFIEDVRMAEQLSGSNRPLAIRQKITEYEDIIVRNGAGCEEIWSVFGQAKDRAFQAITDLSFPKIIYVHSDGAVRKELAW